jgi:hypothetical protein
MVPRGAPALIGLSSFADSFVSGTFVPLSSSGNDATLRQNLMWVKLARGLRETFDVFPDSIRSQRKVRPITAIDQATPAWLTQVLRTSSVLDRGRLTHVRRTSLRSSFKVEAARLELTYSADAPASAPRTLFLKLSTWGKKEVDFYTTIAGAVDDLPIVRCYDAVHAADTSRSHLLLEDLSGTHAHPDWPVSPTRLQCEQAVECIAQVHAHWWGNQRVRQEFDELFNPVRAREAVDRLELMFRDFADFLGDRLSAGRRKLYQQLLGRLFDLWMQRSSNGGAHLTRTHGDAHFWSFLYPLDPESDTTRMIDWEECGVGWGTDDLAYMIALHWYPDRRRAMERFLLTRYHDALLRRGVVDYEWERCWSDYRMSVMLQLLTPVWRWSVGLPGSSWWPVLEPALLAFDDLQCSEFLWTEVR